MKIDITIISRIVYLLFVFSTINRMDESDHSARKAIFLIFPIYTLLYGIFMIVWTKVI